MTIESKHFGGHTVEVKEETRNGVQVGIIKGYIATWDVDRGDDQFVKGCFIDSINEHRTKNRQIRFKDHHGRTVGGFPIDKVKEDEKGLYGEAEVNLEVQQGREAYMLAKQGVLADFSIGYSVIDRRYEDDVRVITKALVWEGSIVDEPMNPHANVIDVKSVVPFQDLNLADLGAEWNEEAAAIRLKEYFDETGPAEIKKAYLFCDSKGDNPSFELPVADVINGRLVAIPAALTKAAEKIKSGTIEMDRDEKSRVVSNIERYFKKMNQDSPFQGEEKQLFVADDVKSWTTRDLERFLKSTGRLSQSAAKNIASRLDKGGPDSYNQGSDTEEKGWDEVLSVLKGSQTQ